MSIFKKLKKMFHQGPSEPMKHHRHWTELPADLQDNTGYGAHEFGYGVYRYDPDTFEILEWWPDFQVSKPEEVVWYQEWCQERNLIPISPSKRHSSR